MKDRWSTVLGHLAKNGADRSWREKKFGSRCSLQRCLGRIQISYQIQEASRGARFRGGRRGSVIAEFTGDFWTFGCLTTNKSPLRYTKSWGGAGEGNPLGTWIFLRARRVLEFCRANLRQVPRDRSMFGSIRYVKALL